MGCMGCDFFQDKDVSRVLEKLKTDGKETAENSLKERLKIEAEKACKLSERNSDFSTLKTQSKEIPEDKIHEYNRAEFEIDKKLVEIEVDKTTKLFDMGQQLADELKKAMLDKFNEQLTKVPEFARPAIKKKVEQMTALSSISFLNSSFGAPLLKALEAYGAGADALEKYVKQLAEATKKRREQERKDFNISTNEFAEDYSEEKLHALIEDTVKKIKPEEEKKE